MKSNNWYNNKIFRFFDYIFRLVLINLMVIIPSFLALYLVSLLLKGEQNNIVAFLPLIPVVLYFFPAYSAGINTVRMYEMKMTNTLFKDFFKNFIKTYLKALIESIMITIIVFLFYNSIMFFYNNINQGLINIIGLSLSISFGIIILMIIIHLPLVSSYMEDLNVFQDIKLAVLMAFKDLLISLGIAIFIGLWIGFLIMYDATHLFLIIGGVSLPIYLSVKLTYKKYAIVYVRTHKEEVEE